MWWWGGIIVSLVFGVGTGIWEGGDGVDVSGIVGWHMVGEGGGSQSYFLYDFLLIC